MIRLSFEGSNCVVLNNEEEIYFAKDSIHSIADLLLLIAKHKQYDAADVSVLKKSPDRY